MDDVFHKLASPQMCSPDIYCSKRVEGNQVTEQNNDMDQWCNCESISKYVGQKEIQTSVKSIDRTLSITINN